MYFICDDVPEFNKLTSRVSECVGSRLSHDHVSILFLGNVRVEDQW